MTESEDDPKTQAVDWLVRLDAGTVDLALFQAWRDADPRHAVAFAEAADAWEQIGTVGPPAAKADPRSIRQMDRRRFLRAASVALPLAVGGAGLFALLRDDRAHAATAIGERRRVEPAPGVTIELNTDSRVAWRNRAGATDIWLEHGEAAVVVDTADGAGLTLHIGDDVMTLRPGVYNVRSDTTRRELLVIEGGAHMSAKDAQRVAVATEGQSVRLEAASVHVEAAAVEQGTAWRRGEIVFDGEPLSDAVMEYNRYLGRKLVISDPEVARIRIGGRFETLRAEPFLMALSGSFDLRAVPRGDMIVIEKNPPSS